MARRSPACPAESPPSSSRALARDLRPADEARPERDREQVERGKTGAERREAPGRAAALRWRARPAAPGGPREARRRRTRRRVPTGAGERPSAGSSGATRTPEPRRDHQISLGLERLQRLEHRGARHAQLRGERARRRAAASPGPPRRRGCAPGAPGRSARAAARRSSGPPGGAGWRACVSGLVRPSSSGLEENTRNRQGPEHGSLFRRRAPPVHPAPWPPERAGPALRARVHRAAGGGGHPRARPVRGPGPTRPLRLVPGLPRHGRRGGRRSPPSTTARSGGAPGRGERHDGRLGRRPAAPARCIRRADFRGAPGRAGRARDEPGPAPHPPSSARGETTSLASAASRSSRSSRARARRPWPGWRRSARRTTTRACRSGRTPTWWSASRSLPDESALRRHLALLAADLTWAEEVGPALRRRLTPETRAARPPATPALGAVVMETTCSFRPATSTTSTSSTGTWGVHNRYLRSRLTGDHVWEEFPATLAARAPAGRPGERGRDRLPHPRVHRDDGPSLRRPRAPLGHSLDGHPARRCSSRRCSVASTATGGCFYGEDVEGGRPVQVRFIWERRAGRARALGAGLLPRRTRRGRPTG